MKAVIVDIVGKYAIALSDKGSFIKIINNGKYTVGCETDFSTGIFNDIRNSLPKVASIAAALLIVFGLSYGTYCYYKPYSFVSIDINPSVEITANVFDRIIKVKGLNSDGIRLLSHNGYKNMKIKEGVDNILKTAAEEGYMKEGTQPTVMLTVSGKDKKKVSRIEEEIKDTTIKKIKSINESTEILVEKATSDKHKDAEEIGISPGKLMLIEKLVKLDSMLNVNDLKDVTVKEIMKEIKNKREEIKSERKDNRQEEEETSSLKEKEKEREEDEEAASLKKNEQEQKKEKKQDSKIDKGKVHIDNEQVNKNNVNKNNGNIEKPKQDKEQGKVKEKKQEKKQDEGADKKQEREIVNKTKQKKETNIINIEDAIKKSENNIKDKEKDNSIKLENKQKEQAEIKKNQQGKDKKSKQKD